MNDIQQYKLRKIEDTILNLKQKTAQNIIDIGNYLNDAKKLMPHGEWGDWLENKVGFSTRSANNYMRIAKEFDSNSQSLADFGNTKLQILLDIPKENRDVFIEENDVKKMSTRELRSKTKKYNNSKMVDAKMPLGEETNNNISFEKIQEHKKRIDVIDNLARENRQKIEILQRENDRLMSERRTVFHTLNKKCPVKYRWDDAKVMVKIYIDFDGRENILYDGWLLDREFPSSYEIRNVPEEYQNDFRMVWNQAYREYEEKKRREREETERLSEELNNNFKNPQKLIVQEDFKLYWKKIFNAALKVYHIDNNVKPQEAVNKFSEEELREYNDRIEECNKMTMLINQLKELYGV
ncbi:MAG: DUF3102 domain-containing protein [Lachnospiraceae bacterium]|nr:DUF3102 domain-containing protein [Lachnospiraceae bacterium]